MSEGQIIEWVDHKIREKILANTRKGKENCFVHPKPRAEKQHALLAVDYGAIDSLAGHFVPTGMAHFLEHRLFDKPHGDITERFAALGADVDAQTCFTQTTFDVSCTGQLSPCIDLLCELALDLHLSEEGVERERQIIAREIELFEDNVEWVCFSNALRALYPDHPISTDIAGTLSSLREIDADTLHNCHATFYRDERISVFVSGDVDEDVITTLETAVLKHGHHSKGNEYTPVRCPPTPRPSRVCSELTVVRPRVYLAFSDCDCGMTGVDLLKKEVCIEMAADILFGPSSVFFTDRYEAGEIDAESFGWETYAEPTFLFCLIGGDVVDADRFEESIREELLRTQKSGIREDDFQRAFRKAYGTLLCRYEDVESCTAMDHSAVSRGALPFDFSVVLEATTLEDVEHCLSSCFRPEEFAVAVVAPARLGSRRHFPM